MAQGLCYLFTGPEVGEQQDTIQYIRQELTKKYGSTPEEQSFYASETTVSDIVSILRNGSLFSDARLILVKNAEYIKKKEDVELLSGYMTQPQEDTTLILISEEIGIDKKLEATIPKEHKKIFWELFDNRKTEWVVTFFKRSGYNIQPDAVEAILELVENNTAALRQECSRLTLFLDKNKPVSADQIEQYLAHTRQESAFSLFSQIALGEREKSLEILHTLLDAKESPQAIIAGLTWSFRKLADFLALASTGQLNDFELKKIGLASPRAQRDYREAAKRYTIHSTMQALALLAEWDVQLRSMGTAIESILMDIYLLKLSDLSSQHTLERI
ncbi:DNA polymerase III subunit delta [Gracilinema caldarium]|uniref:DNA polymerase III subunit delta n=1 Tax=Gracilinema caldarium (strain ATCC 51460 / DSM 7334 / H1) TaxID=744872 RepID=F8EY22_GRAC1|nr:DNA polymerase III subunit delta [Gracilinema caldarium]AEJ20683.1 DNA polymerase III, delta subunit [Gracilinema caldarium DSM 7334]